VRFGPAEFTAIALALVNTLGQANCDERCDAMNSDNVELNQTEEANLLFSDIADEALEVGHTRREIPENIAWAFCPSGLTICRI